MIFIDQLEYHKIKELLVQECQSEPGKTVASKLRPLVNKKEIDHKLELTSEIQECLKNRIYYNFEDVSDISNLLQDFHHQTYNFEEFRKIYSNISAANILKREIKKLEDYHNFYRMVEDIFILSELEKRFNEIYFADGEIKDSASSQLFSIRKRKKKMRKRIVSSLNKKIEDFASNNFLFDKVVTQRGGRFVIPIKEGSVSFVKGIVHGKSASKSSVYMEPEEVVGLNNDIHILESEEKQEIFRILKKYSDDIQLSGKDILKNTEILKQIDFYFASARFAIRLKAEKPKIVEKPYLNLIEARHPLLIESYDDYEKVIAFSLEIGKDFKLLLISGPNTGGKTVTLKTVGILTLMALSGLLIPAKTDSTIGIFPEVFADIGDNQSLENAMSTFSSHMKNIEKMVSKGNSNSLVLIDEIGASTDPEQGSALAQAILEKLVKNKVVGVITTHYTALKIFAEKTKDCINASMQFDPEKHLPTYQFKLGLPGNSFAIEVAAGLGLDEKLIARAKELTGNQNVELTELLKKMGEEKAELARKNYQFSLKTSLLDQKISEHREKIENLEKEGKERKKKSIREAREFLTSLQKELNAEISSIKKEDKKKKKSLYESSLNKIIKLNREFGKQDELLTEEKKIALLDPQVGQQVWVKDIDTLGEIIEIKDDNIKVEVNDIFYTTRKENLFQIEKKKIRKSNFQKRISIPEKETKFELKVLGCTFDEALPLVEEFIDDALLSGLNLVRIVHGKGTGALRSKIRQYLKKSKKVNSFFTPPPETGGDGVTVLKLEG